MATSLRVRRVLLSGNRAHKAPGLFSQAVRSFLSASFSVSAPFPRREQLVENAPTRTAPQNTNVLVRQRRGALDWRLPTKLKERITHSTVEETRQA